MVKNSNLSSAKKQKNDEFYTQLTDVSKELMHYKEHFKKKWQDSRLLVTERNAILIFIYYFISKIML